MTSKTLHPRRSDTADREERVLATGFLSGSEEFDSDERTLVLQELEDVCSDPEFQSSQRNCEFLRFVVQESLSGRGHHLSERSLGVELFGRSETYDTTADAVVRVRANDLRKRLTRHYEKITSKTGWQITLPPRTYQAVFTRYQLRPATPAANLHAEMFIPAPEVKVPEDPRHLTWRQLLTPTLFALVVCAIVFRWQALASDPLMTFWSTLLAGKSSVNLIVDSTPNVSSAVQVSQLRGLGPLLSVTSAFKVGVHFSASAEQPSLQDADTLTIHLTQLAAEPQTGKSNKPPGLPANGVFVEPGSPAVLWLRGREQADIDREIQDLTDPTRFPADAADKLQQNAGYFIPLDQTMQLATARSLRTSTALQ